MMNDEDYSGSYFKIDPGNELNKYRIFKQGLLFHFRTLCYSEGQEHKIK